MFTTGNKLASVAASGTTYAAFGGFYSKNEQQLYVFAQQSINSSSFIYLIYKITGNNIIKKQQKPISGTIVSSSYDVQPFLISRNIESIQSFIICGAQKNYNTYNGYYYSTVCSSGEYNENLIGFITFQGLSKNFGNYNSNIPSYYLTVLSLSQENNANHQYTFCMTLNDYAYFSFFKHNFSNKHEYTYTCTNNRCLSNLRFVLLDQYKLFFTYFYSLDSTIQGFLYYYPYCKDEIITITKLQLTELKDKLKCNGQYISFKTSNNLIKKRTNGIGSIGVNTPYRIEDIFIDPGTTASSITVNFVLSSTPEKGIFTSISSSSCSLKIIVCDNSCLTCDATSINTCLKCDNEEQYYRQDYSPFKCYKGIIPKGYFLDINSSPKSIKKCHNLCHTCTSLGSDSDTQCDICNTGYHKTISGKHCTNIAPIGYALDNADGYWKPCYSKCTECTKLESNNVHYCTSCINDYKLYYRHQTNSKQCYPNNGNPENKFYIDQTDLSYHELGLIEYCPTGYEYLIKETGECSSNCMSRHYDSSTNIYSDLYMYYNKCIQICPVGTTSNNNIPKKCENIYTFKCSDIEFVVNDVEPLPIILNDNNTIIRYIQSNDNVQYKFTLNQNNKKGYFYNFEDYTIIEYDTLFYADIIGYRPIETGTIDIIKYH